jgi:ribonuclease E
MTIKMLIDATHAEETRVVVVDGNKVDEFDFESLNKRQLAGNIYLAKVTRVEPSLQAAFVDYGGNRHGFLAFSEIHPDYYQIPKADREALMAEEAAFAREAEEEPSREKAKPKGRSRSRRRAQPAAEGLGAEDAVVASEPMADANASDGAADQASRSDETGEQARSDDATFTDTPPPNAASGEVEIRVSEEPEGTPSLVPVATAEDSRNTRDDEDQNDDHSRDRRDESESDEYESVGGDDVSEERAPRKPRQRRYKIQEVIKVRQILLVQVVKEERGNKGAALTTYLSLAGRYCVLMPNTARGGGISRKITNAADRKKLKEISSSITVPEGAGLIIRTAGASRTKTEIKRDYEYLLRQWEQIRELTLKSIAPAPIYEEGSLIKRVIRDLYSREMDEILVDGERGYREAKDYMKMLMPSHAKNVKHYIDQTPLFSKFQVENYLSAMFNPVVQLRSGGYIVIDVTEALVAIDVNSGRATREASIEETALKTNLEAAEEAARQMRLRDLAGLIVIDFIDMEDRRNNAAVEKKLKDKLKTDRARIQVGRISGFGLLEMSRQRLRPGMIEATTKPCAHCHGTGRVRSDDSLALALLREVEEEGVKQRSKEVLIVAPVEIANYLLNQKREHIALIESRFGLSVRVEGDASLINPDYKLERFKTASRVIPAPGAMALPTVAYPEDDFAEEEDEAEVETEVEAEVETETNDSEPRANGDQNGDRGGKRKRRRRRRGGRNGEDGQQANSSDQGETGEESSTLPPDVMEPVEDGVEGIATEAAPTPEATPEPRSRSRRRSRGTAAAAEQSPAPKSGLGEVIDLGESGTSEIVEVPESSAPAPRKRERVRRPASTVIGSVPEEAEATGAEAATQGSAMPESDTAPAVEAEAEAANVPDFAPTEPLPELASFESPSEPPVPFDAPYTAPYDTLTSDTPGKAAPEEPVAEDAPAVAEPVAEEPVAEERAFEATVSQDSPAEEAFVREETVAEIAPAPLPESLPVAAETTPEPEAEPAPAESSAPSEEEPGREFEAAVATSGDDEAETEPSGEKRRGWWSRG